MNPITSMLLFTIIVITTTATLIALLTITTITCSTVELLQRVGLVWYLLSLKSLLPSAGM